MDEKDIIKDISRLVQDIESNMVHQNFINACLSGNSEYIKELYKKYYTNKINFTGKILKFLKISNDIIINPHMGNEYPLMVSLYNGNKDIIEFFLNDKKFKEQLDITKVASGLIHSIKTNRDEILKIFIDNIEMNNYAEINDEKLPVIQHIFINACKLEKLEILKNIKNMEVLKSYLDNNPIKEKIKIDHKEIINYLIFEFGLTSNNSFSKNIDSPLFHSLLNKNEAYFELNNELPLNSLNNEKKRKIKI